MHSISEADIPFIRVIDATDPPRTPKCHRMYTPPAETV